MAENEQNPMAATTHKIYWKVGSQAHSSGGAIAGIKAVARITIRAIPRETSRLEPPDKDYWKI